MTDSDARFFVTLARWDSYYYRNLGPQKKRMTEYRNIWAYARDLYEIPAFKNNTYFKDFSREPKNSTIFNSYNAKLNKIAARWPAKAVVQFLISFLKKQ